MEDHIIGEQLKTSLDTIMGSRDIVNLIVKFLTWNAITFFFLFWPLCCLSFNLRIWLQLWYLQTLLMQYPNLAILTIINLLKTRLVLRVTKCRVVTNLFSITKVNNIFSISKWWWNRRGGDHTTTSAISAYRH